jgi:hypothetical protein
MAEQDEPSEIVNQAVLEREKLIRLQQRAMRPDQLFEQHKRAQLARIEGRNAEIAKRAAALEIKKEE